MTFVLAFAILIICVLALGIGYLITGKVKFKCKPCGKPDCCRKKKQASSTEESTGDSHCRKKCDRNQ